MMPFSNGFLLSLSLCLDIGIANIAMMTLAMQRGYFHGFWLGIGTCLAPIVAAFVEPEAVHPVYHLLVAVMALMAVMTNITAFWRISVVMTALQSGAPHRSK